MSWDAYLDNMLFNYSKPSKEGDGKMIVANNVLSAAGIYSGDALAKCTEKNMSLTSDDIKSIQDFKQNKQGSITINGNKYLSKKKF